MKTLSSDNAHFKYLKDGNKDNGIDITQIYGLTQL